MNKTLLALTLGLAASVAGTSAFADSVGQINFTGNINANTCPIDAIDPGTGATGPINLGSVAVPDFGGAADTEVGGREFALRIKDGAVCGFVPGDTASVQFDSTHGNAGTGGRYYGIQTGGATGVALAIQDNDGKHVDSGTQSKDYPLNAIGETRMIFNAKYRSTSATVVPGPVIANINFLVTLP
ncbi:fimbrial protein [Pseudomonas sp. NFX98]|uniref:fimbrial protein n=1 Tax=Pseudomonas sp. NFX98 TaxID=3399122 RepID=UPI0039FCB103